MSDTEIRIVKRIAVYMLSVAEQQVDMQFFQGLGMALAVCFEEMTGSTAGNKKPKDIIQWAQNLQEVRFPRVMD